MANHGYCYKCAFWSKIVWGLCLFQSNKNYNHYTKHDSYCPDYTNKNNTSKIINQLKKIFKEEKENLI